MTARTSPPERRGPGRAPRHASRALAAMLAKNALDGRTWVARALRDLRNDLAADAGGLDHLTARERVLIDRCAAAVLICSTIEAHVLASEAPITDAGELLPILRKGYVTHVQSLSRMLQALSLRPDRADKLPSLSEYLAQRAGNGHDVARPPQPAAPATVEAQTSPAPDDAASAPQRARGRTRHDMSAPTTAQKASDQR